MALTERSFVDQINTVEGGDNAVFVRKVIVTERDGVEIARQYERTSFLPGQDVSDQPSEVQAYCTAKWANLNT